ncbi:Rieske (2Fe-2S) protein [Bradyrhizobium sp. RDT10]
MELIKTLASLEKRVGKFRVGSVDDFVEGSRKVVSCDGTEVGVFMVKGQLKAWFNSCPHMRGPVCQGRIYQRVLEPVAADRTVGLQQLSDEHTHVVCPWHGYEFDLLTGEHPGGGKRLRPVKLETEDREIYVVV